MSDADIYHHVAEHGYKRLITNWTTLPAVMSNQDGYGKDLDNGFVHFRVDYSNSPFRTINGYNPMVSVYGFYEISVMIPQNTGVGLGLTYAGEIAAYYRGKKFEGILCRDPKITTAQQVEFQKGQFWLTPLMIPFQYDIHVSVL